MSGARASPSQLALSCIFILFFCRLSRIHPHPSPSFCVLAGDDHLIVVTCLVRADTLASLSLRTDLIPSFRPPPRTFWSSGLCTFPTMSHRCPFHLFINNPLLCHHVPPTTPHTMSRSERLITASFLQPPPSHITPLPPAHPQLLGRRSYPARFQVPSRVGQPWPLQTLHVCKSMWPGIATFVNYGKTWIAVARAPCGYERLSSGLNPRPLPTSSPTPHNRSRSLLPAQLSHRGVLVTPNLMTESGRSQNVRAPCTIGDDDGAV
jgi:hypothetical protein